MADFSSRPLAERLQRFRSAQDAMKGLLDTPARFSNECEGVFSEFRKACVHLRKDKEALDAVEDKEVFSRFLCKFCKERPVFHSRSEEVIKILMMSTAWRSALNNDPQAKDLPAAIREGFLQDEKDDLPQPPGGDSNPFGVAPFGTIVVQRCASARILTDPSQGKWAEIDRGLAVFVSFAPGATVQRVSAVARLLISANLSGGASCRPGDRAEPVAKLCRQGEAQGILIVPQDSLIAELGDPVAYSRVNEDEWTKLYHKFIESVRSAAKDIIARQLEVLGNKSWSGIQLCCH